MTNGTGAADFLTGLNYLVDIKVGPDGALYVLTDGAGGKILRLVPKG